VIPCDDLPAGLLDERGSSAILSAICKKEF